jgi:hypothetical protein
MFEVISFCCQFRLECAPLITYCLDNDIIAHQGQKITERK